VNDFDGLTVIVTGGASGIGAATANLLHEAGARVAILDRTPTGGGDHLEIGCDM